MEDSKKKKIKSAERTIAPKKLKLLVLIVNTNKADFYTDFLQSFEVNMQMQMHAKGTAGSEMLHYLGLEESDKRVLLGIVREDRAEEIMKALEEKFATLRGGKGIAYTVPLSSVAGVAIYQFLSNHRG
jgi:nitrogen regulatory protein PII